MRGSGHDDEYALAFGLRGACVRRCDNEAGKGDHRRVGELEEPYAFRSPEPPLKDFWKDVDQWQSD